MQMNGYGPYLQHVVANILKHILNMKTYIKIIILGLLISCSQDEPEFEKIDYEPVLLECLYLDDAEFIIETETEYFQMVIGANCTDTIQAPFDFNDYILMGKYTKFDMNDKLKLGVYKYKELKRIIYKIHFFA